MCFSLSCLQQTPNLPSDYQSINWLVGCVRCSRSMCGLLILAQWVGAFLWGLFRLRMRQLNLVHYDLFRIRKLRSTQSYRRDSWIEREFFLFRLLESKDGFVKASGKLPKLVHISSVSLCECVCAILAKEGSLLQIEHTLFQDPTGKPPLSIYKKAYSPPIENYKFAYSTLRGSADKKVRTWTWTCVWLKWASSPYDSAGFMLVTKLEWLKYLA